MVDAFAITKGDHTVMELAGQLVATGITVRNPGNDRGAGLLSLDCHIIHIRLELIEQQRHCGFGPQNQIAVPVLTGLLKIGINGWADPLTLPFLILGDIALYRADFQFTGFMRPVLLLQ